jgi:transcriptional regulator with XRE-family HTH domain
LGAGKLGRNLEELTRAVNGVIARRVKAQRGKLGMSLAELAAASGVRLSKLDGLEHRRTGCSAIELWKISLALDVSISELCEPGRDRAPVEALNRIVRASRSTARKRGMMTDPNSRRVH